MHVTMLLPPIQQQNKAELRSWESPLLSLVSCLSIQEFAPLSRMIFLSFSTADIMWLLVCASDC